MAKEGRDDVQIVLISHGGFLHYFSDDWEGAATEPGTGWTNGEVRSYHFASLNDDPDARVVETTFSRHARGLSHPMPSPAEQEKLFVEAMEGWEAQGLERPDRLEDPASVLMHRRQGKRKQRRPRPKRLVDQRRSKKRSGRGTWMWKG